MYFRYCLVAIGAILLVSLIMFYIMKKTNQANSKNNRNLVICTVLSILCAVIATWIAKYLVNELSFSVPLSYIISLTVLLIAAIVVLLVVQPILAKQSSKESTENVENKDSLVESIIDNASKTAVDSSGINAPVFLEEVSKQEQIVEKVDPAIINEDVIIKEVEDISQTVAIISEEEEKPEQPVSVIDNNYFKTDITKLLEDALEQKSQNKLLEAVSSYEAALMLQPEDDLKFLIILDLCSLYKRTNRPDAVERILASTQCQLLDSEKKEDILRNL